MDKTTNLAMPYIMPSQAQKHVTHNEALKRLDAIVQLGVIARDLAEPPAGAAEGARYIVPGAATGEFAGRQASIAAFQDGAWTFHAPQPGWRAWVESEGLLLAFDGNAWRAAVETLPLLGIAATADAGNPLTVKGPGSLFDHDGAGHRMTLNKADAAETASLVFQTAYSGRAEFGLAGDDDFHIKTSADGAAWTEALRIANDTGDVALPAGKLGIGTNAPTEKLEIVDALPKFRVTGTAHGANITFSITDEGNLFFQKATGDANWNFRLNPLDGTGQAQYLFGQSTGSTGPTLITLLNPDNTAQTRLASDGLDSFVCAQGGDFGIGTVSPDEKLRVAGRIKAQTVLPEADNGHDLGSAGLRYRTIYAATSTITTSDATLKTDVREVPQAVLEALRPVTAKIYRHADAVEAKGAQARWHYGYLAQEIEAALSGVELDGVEADAFRHAFLCRDEILEEVETGRDESGQPITELRPTGEYRYALRYEEFLALREEMHRRDVAALEARVAKLEKGETHHGIALPKSNTIT